MSRRSSSPLRYVLNDVVASFVSAVGRMDKSLNPKDTIARLQNHHFKATEFLLYTFQIALAGLWISLWPAPIFVKLGLPSLLRPCSPHPLHVTVFRARDTCLFMAPHVLQQQVPLLRIPTRTVSRPPSYPRIRTLWGEHFGHPHTLYSSHS